MKTEPRWGQRGEIYVVVQLILLALIFFIPLLGTQLLKWPGPWNMIGAGIGFVLILIGGSIALSGVITLGRNLTAVPYPKEDASMVDSGAYRIVRHPIYSGIICGSLGWALLLNSLIALLLVVFLFILFDLKSRPEEEWLGEKYPEYADYQKRVRRLIPYLY
jgi:protein-S-isoprenylcysteine O-methyltransferase Ste14